MGPLAMRSGNEQLDNVLEWSTSSEPEALPTQPSGKSHNTSLLIIIISLYGYYMYMYGSRSPAREVTPVGRKKRVRRSCSLWSCDAQLCAFGVACESICKRKKCRIAEGGGR